MLFLDSPQSSLHTEISRVHHDMADNCREGESGMVVGKNNRKQRTDSMFEKKREAHTHTRKIRLPWLYYGRVCGVGAPQAKP